MAKKHPGVRFIEKQNKWLAQISFKGKNIHLGFHETKSEALAARKAGEKKYRNLSPEEEKELLEELSKPRKRGPRVRDLTGQTFGKLTVIRKAKSRDYKTHWLCKCECGEETIVYGTNLTMGYTASCGCGRSEGRKRKGNWTKNEDQTLLKLINEGMPIEEISEKIKRGIPAISKKITAFRKAGKLKKCPTCKVNFSPQHLGQEYCAVCLQMDPGHIENKDITGKRFGRLTAVRESPERLRNEIAWICRCDCGNETIATRGQLLRGAKKSCGCLRKNPPANTVDMVGKKFGKLTVIERAGKTAQGNALWFCKCDCGNTTTAMGTSLRRGDTVSCGCDGRAKIDNARKVLMEDMSIDGVQIPLLTKKVRSDSRSGHKGIYKRNRKGKVYYEARITIKGKQKHLGTFTDINKAIAARKAAEKEYFEPYIKALEEKEK